MKALLYTRCIPSDATKNPSIIQKASQVQATGASWNRRPLRARTAGPLDKFFVLIPASERRNGSSMSGWGNKVVEYVCACVMAHRNE